MCKIEMTNLFSILPPFVTLVLLSGRAESQNLLPTPEPCKCDGTQYLVPPQMVTGNWCGLYATCIWSMVYYLEHKEGVMPPPSIPLAGDYYKQFETTMALYIHPFEINLEPHLPECRKGYLECSSQRKELVASECQRLQSKTKWPVEKDPPLLRENFEKNKFTYNAIKDGIWNAWRLWLDGEDGTRPTPGGNLQWGQGLDKNIYTPPNCPSLLRQPHFSLSLLLQQDKVPYHETIMYAEVVKQIQPLTIRAAWCETVGRRIGDLYNQTQFCDRNKWSLYYICVNLKAEKLDTQPRNYNTECHVPTWDGGQPIPAIFYEPNFPEYDSGPDPVAYPDPDNYPDVDRKHTGFGLPWFS